MEREKYLPIGTIVLLKNASKRLMIAGYCTTTIGETTKVWDYCGYRYPEGVGQKTDLRMFDHEQIDKIVYLGLEDDEEKKFTMHLDEIYKLSREELLNKIKQKK